MNRRGGNAESYNSMSWLASLTTLLRAGACHAEPEMLWEEYKMLEAQSIMLRAESRMAEFRMLSAEYRMLRTESIMLMVEAKMLTEMETVACKKLTEEDLRGKLTLPQGQYQAFLRSIPSEVRSRYLDKGFIPGTLRTQPVKSLYLDSEVQLELVGFVPNTDSSFFLQLPRLDRSTFKVDLDIEVRYCWLGEELLLLVTMPHPRYDSTNFLSPPPITRIEISRAREAVENTSGWMDLGEKWIPDNDYTNKIILLRKVDITSIYSGIKNSWHKKCLMGGLGFEIFIWPYQKFLHLTRGMLKVIKIRRRRLPPTVDIEISCTRAYALRGALKPRKMVRVFFRWINGRPYFLLRAGREAFGPEGERRPRENFGDEFIPSGQFCPHWELLPFCPCPCSCCPRWTRRTSDGGLDRWPNIEVIERLMDREGLPTREIDRAEIFENL